MTTEIRTRFAPSPTGDLHLGSLRTALFNWLWARKNKGIFILRIEDTDQNRLIEGSQQKLIDDLRLFGLNWDYGPDKTNPQFGSCTQSQRLNLYNQIAVQLVDQGLAYYDYTSAEELEQLRRQAQGQKKAFVFRQSMAKLEPSEPDQKPVIRIAMPDNLEINWLDVVKGQQSWQTNNIGDFVALKSDGWPTYHLANVIDDHNMQISHVIRADEWLSSTPKHLYLFDCLNWTRPSYTHVPPVLASNSGQKLSKRNQGGQATNLIDDGYLPTAILNYLSLLGWNPKTTQEIFSITDLIEAFDVNQIQVSGAHFDIDRLNWFNGQHLRALPFAQLKAEAQKWWPNSAQTAEPAYRDKVLEITYQRLKKWSELADLTEFFFSKPACLPLDYLIKETKLNPEQIDDLIAKTLEVLKQSDFSLGDLELKLYQLATAEKISLSKYFMLLRLKLTARKVAPGLFETLNVLGLEESLSRLDSK